ncbi:hypothetical protein BSTEL_2170 [Bifidobacterium stellenboschense]|uniref:Uncharacterized protein n=1 Tax=Bifidobacterium stellenboschense TaxID=762211 RepID=A0A087D9H1_9BIFI|nr:hypothetical protein BSTEL_2170 [Bifidobacterium stellenboschense]
MPANRYHPRFCIVRHAAPPATRKTARSRIGRHDSLHLLPRAFRHCPAQSPSNHGGAGFAISATPNTTTPDCCAHGLLRHGLLLDTDRCATQGCRNGCVARHRATRASFRGFRSYVARIRATQPRTRVFQRNVAHPRSTQPRIRPHGARVARIRASSTPNPRHTTVIQRFPSLCGAPPRHTTPPAPSCGAHAQPPRPPFSSTQEIIRNFQNFSSIEEKFPGCAED